MKRNTYYPSRQADQVLWLTNFSNKLPGHAATLGLAAGDVTAAVADCGWVIYVLQNWLPATRAWAQSCTDALTETLSGSGAAAQVLPVFAAPALPGAVVPVNPDALDRIFVLVQSIKDNSQATDAIKTDLRLVGSEQAGPDLSTVQPAIAPAVSGSQVQVKWGWGGNAAWLESCEIQVDRGDGKGFVLLTIDTTPNYTDTQPFPAAKTIWTYKAIFRANDQQVGVWSSPTSVTVGG